MLSMIVLFYYIKFFRKEEDIVVTYIAQKIEIAADKSLEQGQSKYKAFFVKTRLYKNYRDDVDTVLRTDGYEDCISAE